MKNLQNSLLDPSITFLNHGSFGSVPAPVFKQYQAWQLELERQPVEFLGRKAPELLARSRRALGEFLGADCNDLVYTTNVTEAINVVARSLKLNHNDEVLASNMEYGAMDRTWKFLALQSQFKYINHVISVPVSSPEHYIEEFWKGVTPHTRVIFLSHISSPTALIAPVKAICARARQEGILTVIDGAHAPGQIDLNLAELGADFYGANLHKWLCAPKGAGFLYARPEVQPLVEPLIVSWGWQSEIPGPSQFIDYLQWTGTRNIAAYLTVPAAIEYQKEHDWSQVQQRCHHLAAVTLDRIAQWSRVLPIYTPESDWFAQMAACPLPASVDITWLKDHLYQDYHIEVPILQWENYRLARVSFQAYNDETDAEKLVLALKELIGPQ